MNSMVRERDIHVSRLFIEVTPGIRRALELLAEASIALLDEIDAPVDDLEEDPDFEVLFEDDEDTHDAELEEDEPDLGFCEGSQFTGNGRCDDDDIVAPETSAGLVEFKFYDTGERAAHCARFDPRLDRRGDECFRPKWTSPLGHTIAFGRIPPFPHERADCPAFHIETEIRRLNKALMPVVAKKRNVTRRMRIRNKK